MTTPTAQQLINDHIRGKHSTIRRSGWLDPVDAFAFFWQNGTIRQIITRFSTLMVKSGWEYINADVPQFDWSTTQSRLETRNLKGALRLASTWAFIFGGGAIEHIVDDRNQPKRAPLDLDMVREYKGVRVWSAYELRPEPGKNYKTAEWFYPYSQFGVEAMQIHRSRLSIMVSHDVPVGGGYGTIGFVNRMTGWPPSWFEGIYDPFCDWRRAHADASQILRAKSLLHLQLAGYRKAVTSPDSAEGVLVASVLEKIAADLMNDGLLVTDIGDKLLEIERGTQGLKDLLDSKADAFVSSTGVPREFVLMWATGNLGDNSAPIDGYHDMVDGFSVAMLTQPISDATDIDLAAQRYDASLRREELETPREYTVDFNPIQRPSEKEQAETRKLEADSRLADSKAGVDVSSDPSLTSYYPAHAAKLEEEAKAKKAAQEYELAQASEHPPGESMVSAATVAAKVGVSTTTVIARAKAGEWPAVKMAGRWRFYLSKVLMVAHGKQAQAPVDMRDAYAGGEFFGDVYGASASMQEIFEVLAAVKPYDIPVLLLGETGTGKEGIARALHRGGEFVRVNCAALPDDAEDVAEEIREAIERARGGSLFLDEIGDLPRWGQSALLSELSGDLFTRLISATSLDCGSLMRPDLYYRLKGAEIEIPPLRDREGDVLWLAERFYEQFTAEAGITPTVPPFSDPAQSAMEVYAWPGNVRELKNTIARAAALAGHGTPISVEHLQLRPQRAGA